MIKTFLTENPRHEDFPLSISNTCIIILIALREAGKKEVETLLKSLKGPKCVVLDPVLSKPLNLVTEVHINKVLNIFKIKNH